MSDYEKRLERLEEQATIADDSGALLMEAIRKRNAELFSPAERLATEAERDADPERFKAEVEAFCAAASLKAAEIMKRVKSPQ